MINLWKYQEAKKIKLTDVDDEVFVGTVLDVTDSSEYADEEIDEDGITIDIDGRHIEFMQSEVKEIEILE